MKKKKMSFMLASFLLTIFFSQTTLGCSRILWNTNDHAVMSARSMDWGTSFNDHLFIYPRGISMKGDTDLDDNTAQWVSRYGSVTSNIYGCSSKLGFGIHDGVCEGINEKGLATHILYLGETQYEERDTRPSVTYMRWARYVLDNFATVEEALAGMQDIQIIPVPLGDESLGVHMAIEDPSGDSAIIEFIEGERKVYHGKKHTVMTNDPSYDKQLKRLMNHKGFKGDIPIPGDTSPQDRFVRSSYYLQTLPEPVDKNEAFSYMFSIIRNVAVPFGAPYEGLRIGQDTYPTWWMSVTDLTNRIFYFHWTKNIHSIWLELDNIDFSEGNSVQYLDPQDRNLVGEISDKFIEIQES